MSSSHSERYNQRGVSASKEDVHHAIKNIDKGLFPKAFCKIVPDYLTGDADYCLVMHADGAGTKSSLAYMYWKETGDVSVWKGIAQDALIMNIDDLICVGATDNIMLSSTIGRNKNLIPGEVISAIIHGTEELISALQSFGIHIHSTGGETADVGDLVRTIIVDSTVTARLKRSDVINNANIKAGDVIVIPAGVGHKNLGSSADLLVVGAYPPGQRWDLCDGSPGERPWVLKNIAAVPLPAADPVFGVNGPLVEEWKG